MLDIKLQGLLRPLPIPPFTTQPPGVQQRMTLPVHSPRLKLQWREWVGVWGLLIDSMESHCIQISKAKDTSTAEIKLDGERADDKCPRKLKSRLQLLPLHAYPRPTETRPDSIEILTCGPFKSVPLTSVTPFFGPCCSCLTLNLMPLCTSNGEILLRRIIDVGYNFLGFGSCLLETPVF